MESWQSHKLADGGDSMVFLPEYKVREWAPGWVVLSRGSRAKMVVPPYGGITSVPHVRYLVMAKFTLAICIEEKEDQPGTLVVHCSPRGKRGLPPHPPPNPPFITPSLFCNNSRYKAKLPRPLGETFLAHYVDKLAYIFIMRRRLLP